MAATDDPAVNAAVAAAAERARVFCSRADDASAATAWTPAVGAHAGVVVSVLSAGDAADPRRSAAVRDAVVEGLRERNARARRGSAAARPASPWSAAVPATPT